MLFEESNVRNWASIIDGVTLDQAYRTGRHPMLAHPVALMPDAHFGIGATVGSVLVTRGSIIPSAVGVDIGCGMEAVQTTIPLNNLPDSLDKMLDALTLEVPGGIGSKHLVDRTPIRNEAVGVVDDLAVRATQQMGTLGSGNHFLELCKDGNDTVWIMLHSGSRGVGNILAQKFIKLAKAQEQGLEDPELNYFLQGTDEFQQYIYAMFWSQAYAAENRREMINAALNVLFLHTYGDDAYTMDWVQQHISCHHNFAQEEDIAGEKLWVTRKGAIQAREGQLGIIPSAMGQPSYIVRGRGNALSYYSSSHGAGRIMSRGQAKRTLSLEVLDQMMAHTTWNKATGKSLVDEHPHAYKDLNTVMADQADLTEILFSLTPILNYKGV